MAKNKLRELLDRELYKKCKEALANKDIHYQLKLKPYIRNLKVYVDFYEEFIPESERDIDDELESKGLLVQA